ncbi:hypothetical protein BT96DRAFT_987091 [Gymnopus androsaceus JB14]|uniref:DUF7702 domain-containing protein n=1 Tax=Gymnopus androsaceus JB14 TaxID=1447944 RepID=A0A6A4I4I5_9AGAR|nr:hypothetical protein BT96DRAFT_987091 [Gymnopus androsaceus JB14]
MSSTEAINYATFFGFDSVAAAAVFAALYTLLFCFFLFRVLKQRRWILISLLVFCAFRITGFIMRAVATKMVSDGENLGFVVATETLFSVGFFGLLFCAFILVVARYELCQTEQSSNPLVKNFLAITRNSRIFRIVMTVPIGLSIAGLDESVEHPEESIGLTLRKVSAAVFLVLTIFQLIQTLLLIKTEHDDKRSLKYTSSTFGARHASVVFGAISLLLLIRGVFSLATVGNTKANNEHFWYPLVAVPEILCVFLYLIPGVVPPKVVPRDMESLPMDPK